MRPVKYVIYSIILLFVSCVSDHQTIPFPDNENEFAPPIIKKLGKQYCMKVKPNVIPLIKDRPDSIKPPKIVKLGKPKIVPFVNNKKTLGKPNIVPFKQPDTIYYFTQASMPLLQNENPGKTLIKIQEPMTNTIKRKIVLLGQPEKVNCKPAQTADNAINNLKFYTQDQGLVATAIQCMCFDKKGNLWIGTDGGLCKFDGKEWSNYTIRQGLSNNNITSLLEIGDGNLIIGTNGGGLNILYSKYQYLEHIDLSDDLDSENIRCLLLSREGNLLIGTSGAGLYTLNPATLQGIGDNTNSNRGQILKHYSAPQGLRNKNIISLLETRDGDLIIGTNGGGVNVLDFKKHSLKHYSEAQGLSNNFISCLLESKDGNLIIGTKGGGLNILNPCVFKDKGANTYRNLKQSITHYSAAQGLNNNFILSLLESRDGSLIIGTNGGGLNIVGHGSLTLKDSKKQNLLYYSKTQGLSNNYVCSLLENRDGQILIGTFGGGLNMLDDNLKSNQHQYLRNYGTAEGLSDGIVLSLFESRNGDLIIGNRGGGVNILHEKSQIFELYSKDHGLSNNNVFCLLENYNGNIIVGTDRGGLDIIDFKKQNLEHYSKEQGLSSDNIWSLLESKDGNLIIGTSGGGLNILNFRSQYLTSYNAKHGLSNNYILCLLESRNGNLIIGTSGGGLNLLNVISQNLTHINMTHGLSNNYINCLLESRNGKLFVGTSNGLNILDSCVFKPGNLIRNNLMQYSTAQGLPSDYILSIKEDSLGNIWLGTSKGLCKMIKKNSRYIVQKIFDKREGLKQMDFNNNAICVTNTGKLWAGAGNVLTEFDPYVKTYTNSPETYITAVDVMENKEPWISEKSTVLALISNGIKKNDTIWSSTLDTFYLNGELPIDTSFFVKQKIKYSRLTEDIYHLPLGLQLPFSKNHLTFHFTGICIAANSDRIRYRYIMEGLNDKWSSITEKTEVDYRNIPPGNYVFKVSARSVNGYWSKPVEFAFMVLPPWYQTYWAYFIYFVSLIIIAYTYDYLRQRKLKSFSKLLVETQEEEKRRISRELHDDLGQQLSYFRINYSLTDEAKQTIDQIIQKVRTISYDLKPLKIYKYNFKEILEQLIKGVKSNIYFSYEIEEINSLTSEQKIHLYRITQEAINNILKHSNANNARVTFLREGDQLVLEVMDDGVGFKTKKKHNSVGLTSMQERARLINAKLKIVNLEKGTKINVSLKHG